MSFSSDSLTVRQVLPKDTHPMLIHQHYAKRVPSISFAFGLFRQDQLIGVCTFGTPSSRHMQLGACPSNPSLVVELNRLFVVDEAAKNTESWFLAKALKLMPGRIVLSYADTVHGHFGYVYRAANFFYAGWTDMERKTPRYDYVVEGKHSRDAFRGGEAKYSAKVRRKPKVKYWTVSGGRRDKSKLQNLCLWRRISWLDYPPPAEHQQLVFKDG